LGGAGAISAHLRAVRACACGAEKLKITSCTQTRPSGKVRRSVPSMPLQPSARAAPAARHNQRARGPADTRARLAAAPSGTRRAHGRRHAGRTIPSASWIRTRLPSSACASRCEGGAAMGAVWTARASMAVGATISGMGAVGGGTDAMV